MYKIVGYVGLGMSIFFMFAGGFVAFRQILPPPPDLGAIRFDYFQDHPELFNYLVGGLLIAYGAFRLYRSWRLIQEESES
ncbi:MAG: hypothetical protein SF053_17360 [Bacteroidia bacterium]|nr:hypothetical protein [Bacteroidia bacterium]